MESVLLQQPQRNTCCQKRYGFCLTRRVRTCSRCSCPFSPNQRWKKDSPRNKKKSGDHARKVVLYTMRRAVWHEMKRHRHRCLASQCASARRSAEQKGSASASRASASTVTVRRSTHASTTRTRKHASTHVRMSDTHAHMCIRKRACMHTHVHAHPCRYACTHAHVQQPICMPVHLPTRTLAGLRAHAFTHVCFHAYTRAQGHAQGHTQMGKIFKGTDTVQRTNHKAQMAQKQQTAKARAYTHKV